MISQVAHRYAQALYEVAAAKSQQDQFLNELRAIAEIFTKHPEILSYFTSPTMAYTGKQQVLKEAFSGKASPDVYNLLLLLNEKQRLNVFSEIVEAFEFLIDDARGISKGVVRSASPLDPEQRKRLEETVKKVTKKQVILKFEIDPELVGGLIAKVGGWTFDDSLSSHLQTMREELSRRTIVGH